MTNKHSLCVAVPQFSFTILLISSPSLLRSEWKKAIIENFAAKINLDTVHNKSIMLFAKALLRNERE